MVEKKANPAPLGLIGFGMTTVLLNLHNMGLFPLSIMIMSMGVFVGGVAQLIAGVIEFKEKNTFGATAFVAYGAFWLSLVLIWSNPLKAETADKTSMGAYLLMWGIFTLFMFIATLKHNVISRIIFGTLTLLFILLALGCFLHNETVTFIAGIVGVICGISAIYSSAGQIINAEFGRKVLPLL